MARGPDRTSATDDDTDNRSAGRKPRGMSTHNTAPQDIPDDVPAAVARAEFAKRLQHFMVDKGWNQTELARRATEHLPTGKKIGRDSMSQYINAVNFPSPNNLRALAKALGVETTDLMPTRGVKTADSKATEVALKRFEDGTAWLRINERVPWATALRILSMLDESKQGPKG